MRLAGRGQPARIEDCDGRRFQQAYRDDIDLAKVLGEAFDSLTPTTIAVALAQR